MASSQTSETGGGGIGFMFRALRHRNYALFFSGQMVSMVGTWMTSIAMSWLVYKLTGSALLLGIVGFSGQIPSFLLAPVAGVLIDRWNRRSVLITTQVLAMLQSGALAVLDLTGTIQVSHVIALALFQGFINAFDMPARQAFVVEMVTDRNDLPNAIALNSTLFNGSRLIGPSIGGAVIAAVGEGWCFAIDSVSYIAVIGSLLAMNIAPSVVSAASKMNIGEQLREGFSYVAGSAPIRSILLFVAVMSLAGFPYTVLMPIYANEILAGGPNLLGFLMAASGVGAVIGAIFLANRRSVVGLGRFIPIMGGLFGAGLITFSFSRIPWLSLLVMVAIGLGFMVQMAVCNTLIQTIVDEDKRGRVMSFYTMAFMGTAPFGSLIAGSLAEKIGAPNTLLIGGSCCVAAAIVFQLALPRLRQFVRPIYIEKGILPEIGSGVMQASRFNQAPSR
jgi:MFS family permease